MRRRARHDLARRLERLERITADACHGCGSGGPGALALAWPGHDADPCTACGELPIVVLLAFDPHV